ncbi:MAG TPA: T9SS type A sorting domain-containing protein [Bacteroidota bacterium]
MDGRFLLSATRLNHDMGGGDIYGLFLPATTTDVRDTEPGVHPGEFSLEQNYPNPFNPITRISFSLKTSGFISLKVFDLLGREVATLVDGKVEAGTRTVEFDASGLSGGMYFYQLRAGAFVQVRKMAVVK